MLLCLCHGRSILSIRLVSSAQLAHLRRRRLHRRSMAIPVARVHLAMAHAALPALLPTPPKSKMLPLLPTPPPPCVTATAILQAQLLAKPSRAAAAADERWDARKTKPVASAEPSASSGPRSGADSVRSSTGHGSSSPRKNTTSPPPKPGRADSVERWDARKKAAASSASSSSSSSSGKWPISRASSAERWDVHKKCCPPQDKQLDDGEGSSTGSNDIDTEDEEEEEILWKPRAMYAGSGFVAAAAPESSMLRPMPTALLVPVG